MNHLLPQTVYERVKNAKTAENAMQLYLNHYFKNRTKNIIVLNFLVGK